MLAARLRPSHTFLCIAISLVAQLQMVTADSEAAADNTSGSLLVIHGGTQVHVHRPSPCDYHGRITEFVRSLQQGSPTSLTLALAPPIVTLSVKKS